MFYWCLAVYLAVTYIVGILAARDIYSGASPCNHRGVFWMWTWSPIVVPVWLIVWIAMLFTCVAFHVEKIPDYVGRWIMK